MSHSVFFFGVPSSQVELSLSDMYEKASSWIDLSPASVCEEELSQMKRLVSDILENRLPKDCDSTYFDAMLVIAQSNFEEITFPVFTEYRDESFPEHVGIIRPGNRFQPPFPVPRMSQQYPRAGFIPQEHLRAFQFEPGGLAKQEDLESLEDELGDLLMDLGMGNAASVKGRLTGNFDEDFLEEIREDLEFAFEKLSAENKSLFYLAT
ncbi:MAG: hypothetical protein ACK5PB_16685 [Pirellula sp.]